MYATNSTTLDLKFLQGILPIEDLRESSGYKNLRSIIEDTRSTLLSLKTTARVSL